MAEAETSGRRALDEELAPVRGAVMGATERDEVVGMMGPVLRTELEVMQVDIPGVLAARYSAAAMISKQYGSAERRRNGLRRARWCGGIADAHVGVASGCELMFLIIVRHLDGDVPELLGVALSHGNHVGSNRHELTFGVLRSRATLRANGERDLVAGPAFVTWAAKDVASHRQQCRVVVERRAGVTLEHAERLAKQCERLGRYFEAQDVATQRRILGGVRVIARCSAGQDFFELSKALSAAARC